MQPEVNWDCFMISAELFLKLTFDPIQSMAKLQEVYQSNRSFTIPIWPCSEMGVSEIHPASTAIYLRSFGVGLLADLLPFELCTRGYDRI